MSTPIVYRSSDASAPVLNGNAGSLVTVLDACLVNGYGSKAAAGWTKSFSGTNGADYRQGGGSLFYLEVNDNSPNGTSLGKEAAIRGFEAMTAYQTGTNAFPTTGQIASPGLRVRKSSATGASAVAWVVIADDRTLYMCTQSGDVSLAYTCWGFGDYYGLKSGDAYKCFIKAGITMNVAPVSSTPAYSGELVLCSGFNASNTSGFYIARGNAGSVGALAAIQAVVGGGGTNTVPQRAATYANPSDSSLYLAKCLINEPGADIRGYLRGFYQMLNSGGITMADKDTFSGTGDLAGRTFVVVGLDNSNAVYMAFETTVWDTSS